MFNSNNNSIIQQPNCVIVLLRQSSLFKDLRAITIILGRERKCWARFLLSSLCFPYNRTPKHIAILAATTRVQEPTAPTNVGGVSNTDRVGAEYTVNGSLRWLNSYQPGVTTGSLFLCRRPFFKAQSLCCWGKKV